jgi:hypothetical protein
MDTHIPSLSKTVERPLGIRHSEKTAYWCFTTSRRQSHLSTVVSKQRLHILKTVGDLTAVGRQNRTHVFNINRSENQH